jgi:uncharacterized protein (TIGR03435 family)
MLCSSLGAQNASIPTPVGPKPSFDVVSIKPNTSGGPTAVGFSGNRFIATNVWLQALLQRAYSPRINMGIILRPDEIAGAPSWADPKGDRFDIEAKPESDSDVPAEQMWRMVQSLLEDRFQLRTHYEMRELTVFALVVGKNGAKIKLSDGQDTRMKVTRTPSPSGAITVGISGTAQPISAFVQQVQSVAGRSVIDRTGLKGVFDFFLEFNEATVSTDSAAKVAGQAPPPALSDPSGSSLFTAIQEQLGLKLDAAKEPVPVLVIDSVQKPSRN